MNNAQSIAALLLSFILVTPKTPAPPFLSKILKHSLSSRSLAYSIYHCTPPHRCRIRPGHRCVCYRNLVTSIHTLIMSDSVPLLPRPSGLGSAVPVWISGLPVFTSAGKERSDRQTMSRQACHQVPAPALHLTQNAYRTETSR